VQCTDKQDKPIPKETGIAFMDEVVDISNILMMLLSIFLIVSIILLFLHVHLQCFLRKNLADANDRLWKGIVACEKKLKIKEEQDLKKKKIEHLDKNG
jgi:hypothetical protein